MPPGEIYIKLVVGFPNDPRVRALSRFGCPDAGLARDLYVQMCLYCQAERTDGFVPAEQIGLLVYPLDLEHGNQLAKQLASVGLTTLVSKPETPGWQVGAFLKRNRSREEVDRLSEVRTKAGRNGGRASRKPAGQKASRPSGTQVANQVGNQVAKQKVSKPVSVSANADTDTNQNSTSSGAQFTAQTVLGDFIDWDRANGGTLTQRTRGQVAKTIADLLAQDVPDRHIRSGLADWRASGNHPSTLDSFVNARMKGSSTQPSGNGHAGSPAPGPDRARAWMAAGAAFQQDAEQTRRELPSR